MSFPPNFDNEGSYKYPEKLDLDRTKVFYEDTPGDFFQVEGSVGPFGYGKHYFLVSFNNPIDNE